MRLLAHAAQRRIALRPTGRRSELARTQTHHPMEGRPLVRELPVHPQGAAIAAAVTSIARELALEVIAEGVETEEQRRFVCEHHFHHLQGYLVSPPIPPEGT